jgi:hypothetical protein
LPLAIIEIRRVIDATADTTRLLQLDAVWTAAVTGGPPPEGAVATVPPYVGQREPGAWIAQLDDLVGEMRPLILSINERGSLIADIAHEHYEEAEDSLNSLLWDDVLPPSDRETLRWWTARRGGLPGMLNQIGSERLEAEQEIRALDQQLDMIRSGGKSTGDLSKSFRCGSVQQLLVGGVLAVPVAAGGGVTVAVTAGALAGVAVASTGGLAALAIIGAALWWARRYRC